MKTARVNPFWAGLAVFLCVSLAAVFAFRAYRASRAAAALAAGRETLYRSFGIYAPGTQEYVPLPPEIPHRPGAALLGAQLFNDRRLVKSSRRTCGSCHAPVQGGVDNRVHGGRLTRSAFNAPFASCFLYDGRLERLDEAVADMVTNAFYGAHTLTGAIARLTRDGTLKARFAAHYETGLVSSNVVDALVQHLRSRVPPAGAFDRHLSGDGAALTPRQQRGFAVFREAACAQCHHGPALGGRSRANGRKVPALRGLAKRAVYLTDGSARDLPTALMRMPVAGLEDADRSALVDFLGTL